MSLQNNLKTNYLSDVVDSASLSRTRLSQAILLILSSAMWAGSASAMESLDEQSMSNTTGADGLVVNVQADGATFGRSYWLNPVLGKQIQYTGTKLSPVSPLTTVSAQFKINAGSAAGVPALNMSALISPFLLAAPKFEICAADGVTCNTPLGSGPNAAASYIGFQTTTPTAFSLVTTKGLFNSTGTANVTLSLNAANAFFTPFTTSASGLQLVGQNINVNINSTDGSGRIWIDPTEGFRFSGNINFLNLAAPSVTTAGVQGALILQNPGGTGTTLNTPNAGGFVRIGVSGQLNNAQVTLRGTQGTAANEDGLGAVLNDSLALRISGAPAAGTLAADGTGTGFQFEISTAGFNAAGVNAGYGIQMTNFKSFSNVLAPAAAGAWDTGNVYLGLVNPANSLGSFKTGSADPLAAGKIPLPAQPVFSTGTINTANFFAIGSYDAATNTFNQSIQATDSLLLAVRGLKIQNIPLTTYFYQGGSTTGTCNNALTTVPCGRVTGSGTQIVTNSTNKPISGPTTGTVTSTLATPAATGFSLLPVLYGVNTNLAINGNAGGGLGFAIAFSTQGSNGGTTDATLQSTNFLLADTAHYQYVGLRNVDFLLQASGTMTFTQNGVTTTTADPTCVNYCINLISKGLVLAMSADFASGYLPGAEPGLAGSPAAPGTFAAFADPSNKDTAFHINFLINGDKTANSTLTFYNGTNMNGALGIAADFTFAGVPTAPGDTAAIKANAGTSFLRLSQPICTGCTGSQGATIGLDNLTGRIQFAAPGTTTLGNTVPGTQLLVGANGATISSSLIINPMNVAGGELLANVNFYSNATTAVAAPLGKMVITGGQFISNLTIKPVNF